MARQALLALLDVHRIPLHDAIAQLQRNLAHPHTFQMHYIIMEKAMQFLHALTFAFLLLNIKEALVPSE